MQSVFCVVIICPIIDDSLDKQNDRHINLTLKMSLFPCPSETRMRTKQIFKQTCATYQISLKLITQPKTYCLQDWNKRCISTYKYSKHVIQLGDCDSMTIEYAVHQSKYIIKQTLTCNQLMSYMSKVTEANHTARSLLSHFLYLFYLHENVCI